jgi:CRP/FNR family transcriptional regulator, anaerobic regulatory protein
MSKEELIGRLSGIADLSAAFRSALAEVIFPELYRTRQIIGAPGGQQRMWLVGSGTVRRYYYSDAGREITESFYASGELIFSWEGYWSGRTDAYLEALTPGSLYALRYADLEAIRHFPEYETLTRHFLLQQRRMESGRTRLLLLSAEERYRRFRKMNPAIFREVSLRIIASYLNMTRENLSRLIAKN